MTLPRLLASATAAVLALGASTALAQHAGHGQHDMNDMHAQAQQRASTAAAHGIAEGRLEKGVRVFDVAVTEDGFVPARVKANKGEKVRFLVTRKTDSTCAKEIVIADQGVNQPLPLGKTVTVEFTPTKSGEIRYACGMNHVAGVVFVP